MVVLQEVGPGSSVMAWLIYHQLAPLLSFFPYFGEESLMDERVMQIHMHQNKYTCCTCCLSRNIIVVVGRTEPRFLW